jgi:hypothetical protein
MRIVLLIAFIFFISCKAKKEVLVPDPKPIPETDGDTCRISRITFPGNEVLEYVYADQKISQIILKAQGREYVTTARYDANGRLEKLSGPLVECTYEYDEQNRVIRENRLLDFNAPRGQGHYQARIFEYGILGLMVKCSYVEGADHGLNTSFIPKGQIFAYETYEYNSFGNIKAMTEYYTNHPSAGFVLLREWEYEYDDKINPFFGHPGLKDYGIFLGAEYGNAALVFSRNNRTKGRVKGLGEVLTSYQYNSANHPSVGTDVFWQNEYLRPVTFEYENCKN